MNSILDYSYQPSEQHPVQCEYIAIMYRGNEPEVSQSGYIWCRSHKAAQVVINEWNALSQKHRASIDGEVVWNYELKGQE